MASASPARRVPEIEYLRAIAVVAVILHHLGLAAGGFIGVDLFFVISGFVISQALYHSDGTSLLASLRHFYYRRIIRILPPLMLVTLASLLLGWWLFFEQDLEPLQEAVASQALFLQNVHFVGAVTDYFRAIASTQLTLHTWSLAVEEQFYLVFPMLFLLLFRSRLFETPLLSIATVAAMTVTATYFAVWNDAALHRATAVVTEPFVERSIEPSALRFYSMSFRSWEFLLGCCAFTFRRHLRPRLPSSPAAGLVLGLAFLAGMALLAAAAFVKLEVRLWPNGQTVVIGAITACSLVVAGVGREGRAPGLVGAAFAYVGSTSYSAYLWHWPVLGYFAYTNFDFGAARSDYVIFGLVLAMLVSLTYHTIERYRFRITPAWSVVVLVAFVIGSYGLGHVKRDLALFSDVKQTVFSTARYDAGPCEFHPDALKGRFVVLFGDSHMQMVRATFHRAAARYGFEVLCIEGSRARLGSNRDGTARDFAPVLQMAGYHGTLMALRWNMYSVGFPPYEVEESGNRFLEWKGERPRDNSEGLEFFRLNMGQLLDALETPARPTALGILLQVPQMPFFAHKEALVDVHGLRFRPLPVKSLAEHEATNAPVARTLMALPIKDLRLSLLDPAPLLCPDGSCPYRHGWKALYKDDDHLSVYGSSLLEPLFLDWFKSLDDGSARQSPESAVARR